MKRSLIVAFGCLVLAGCISTQEMPLAPNMVRLDTQSRGLLFTGQTVPQTMRTAALATVNRGYTHFRFADAALQQGSVVTGVVGSSNGSFGGTCAGGFCSGNSNGFATGSVLRAPTASAAATVIMFHADEAGAKDAFVAEDVLRQYSS
jgi:hypothetical protein